MTTRYYNPRLTRRGLLQIFKDHFSDFKEKYDEEYATTYGNYRIERITEVVEEFIKCGFIRVRSVAVDCGKHTIREEFDTMVTLGDFL